MIDRTEPQEYDVESLRSRMDADARFKRVFSGYDPDEVRAYVEGVKRVFTQQSKAAKEQQETLIADLESARSEIQARNYAIKALKDSMSQQEVQLSATNARLNSMSVSVRAMEAERAETDKLRTVAASARTAMDRAQRLEKEVQQLRATLSQAANLLETWKVERENLKEENGKLNQEIAYYRKMMTITAAQQELTGHVDMTHAAPQKSECELACEAPAGTQNAQPADIAERLAETCAKAFSLINQLRAGNEQQNAAQPRMQVLRPNGSYSDYNKNGKQ